VQSGRSREYINIDSTIDGSENTYSGENIHKLGLPYALSDETKTIDG